MFCVSSRYFSKAFTIWSKQKKFTGLFITNLISHIEADHAAGAWLLLSKVVASAPKLPYGKILDSWDTMIRWARCIKSIHYIYLNKSFLVTLYNMAYDFGVIT